MGEDGLLGGREGGKEGGREGGRKGERGRYENGRGWTSGREGDVREREGGCV